MTERVAYDVYPIRDYADPKEKDIREKLVADRDRDMISRCQAMIAEFSGASTGTGWEICYATRVRRKPTLCLYDERSNSSLVVKQDDCKYTIVQMYSDETDFEVYVRCFLEIVSRFDDIDKIKRLYSMSKKIVRLKPAPYEISKFIESLVAQTPQEVKLDFKDAEQFIQFLFKNLVLQKRWDRLRSQEIGATFVGGRKSRIIKTLSLFEDPVDISGIYSHEGESKIKYTQEAFTKNLRAFRKIGLVQPAKSKLPYSNAGVKFKEQIEFVRTLSGDIQMLSSRSHHAKMDNLIIATNHLRQLAWFLSKFGSSSLVTFLQQSKKEKWYSEIPSNSVYNVDEINISKTLEPVKAQKLASNLQLKCKKLWEESYASFA